MTVEMGAQLCPRKLPHRRSICRGRFVRSPTVTSEHLPDDDPWRRPDGVDDATVRALGTLGEALEWIERARGHLYEFHHLVGHADELFGDAADELRAAGHHRLADMVDRDVIGRNVIDGRWTFQIVEEFDERYYRPVEAVERNVRNELVGGRRHVYEAEMKERRRTRNHPDHHSRP
jgi:hypothetical protein